MVGAIRLSALMAPRLYRRSIAAPRNATFAMATIERFVARAARLYRQDRKEPSGPSRLGICVRRWSAWAAAGLRGIVLPRTPGKFHLLGLMSDAVAFSSAALPQPCRLT